MTNCTTCGRSLGEATDCPNCAPSGETTLVREADMADWRTDTAERPAVKASPPAPRTTADSAPATEPEVAYKARFPLFADDQPAPRHPDPPGGDQISMATAPPASGQLTWVRLRPWLLVGLSSLLFTVFALTLIMSRSSGDTADSVGTGRTPTPSADAANAADSTTDTTTAAPANLVARTRLTVPATAKPNEDVFGNPVSFAVGNLHDGDPGTAWRMPGDGTGQVVTIELPAMTRLTAVGLINGYAKTGELPGGKTRNWYTGNRRVDRVQWIFDGGTVIDQDLRSTRQVQSITIPPTTTDRIQLKLVAVSAPGTGVAGRNFTAISELSVVGVPAG